MEHILSRISILAFTLAGLQLSVLGAELLGGPMVGHTTVDSAKIWLETDQAASVKIRYWQEPRVQYGRSLGEPVELGEAVGRTSDTAPHIAIIELENLNEGWMIYYEVELDGRALRAQVPQVFSLMPPQVQSGDSPDEISDFSVAFASCTFPARVPVQPVWGQIAQYRPAALMLIGDNNYMPNADGAYETSQEVMEHVMPRYHRILRNLPGLRTLLATTPTYGVWDDHDYGPNNSDRTFKWKELSLSAFKQYYPNASAGLPDVPGVFTSFRIADVEFFLLDDRYHRDPNNAPNPQTMLGEEQLQWLQDGLAKSTATFKVVVNGGSMLVNRFDAGESWYRFGDERDRFLEWLSQEEITGVVFAAGDWHVGTVNRLYRPGDFYPFYELLSSNAGVSNKPFSEGEPGHARFHQFAGPEFRGYNFGLLSFSGSRGQRSVTLKLIDELGEEKFSLRLSERQLSESWNQR